MPDHGKSDYQHHQEGFESARSVDVAALNQDAIALCTSWRIALSLFFILFAICVVLFWQTIGSMVAIWWSDRTYGHCFLVLPIAVFLMWNCRDWISKIEPHPQPFGLILLAGAVIVWLLADVMGIQLFQQLAVIGMIQCLVLLIFGWSIVRRVLFPLWFLFFAVPFGNFLISPLQDLTAQLSVAFLRLSGIPVYLDELFIHIPSGQFVVAEACSGIRFLISTIVLGSLFAHLMAKSWPRRIVILSLSVVIPIIANGFRVYGIVLLAYISDHEIAVGADHLVYGWVFFSFVTLCLLAAALLLRDKDITPQPCDASTLGAYQTGIRWNSGRMLAVSLAAVVILISGPSYSSMTQYDENLANIVQAPNLVVQAPWTTGSHPGTPWRPSFPNPDGEWLQTYGVKGEQEVEFYVAFYSYQRDGAETVNEMNRFGDENIWRRVGGDSRSVVIDGQQQTVEVVTLASGEMKRQVWYWYWVDGEFTGDRIVAKLLQARARLLGGIQAAAVIAVAAEYEESPEAAETDIERFLGDVESFEEPLIAATRGRDSLGRAQ